jgi:selenoprotein W-related protein
VIAGASRKTERSNMEAHMKLEITYCVPCGHLPRAAQMAAEIHQARGIETALIKGDGGTFDVVLDGELIFSRKQAGRFPEIGELLDKIPVA